MEFNYHNCFIFLLPLLLTSHGSELTKGLDDASLLNHVATPKSVNIYATESSQVHPSRFYCRSNSCSLTANPCSKIVPRLNWGTRDARTRVYMRDPVSIVFIHHTVMERCYTPADCQQAVHKVQELHMDVNQWDDIGYSFIVGEDGNAYEARGFGRVGAHTLRWNNVSIGIGVMGLFSDDVPNGQALEAINNIIECGIALGKIKPDYKLYGHCDARPMFESPGKKFYELIKTWPNYGHKMLLTIP